MGYKFELEAGVNSSQIKGVSCKFLAFLIFQGKEIPYYVAKKQGLLERPQINPTSKHELETDIDVVKIFISEANFGSMSINVSFYLQLGSINDTMQIVTITPTNKKLNNYFFKAPAVIMKNSEVYGLLDPDGMSAKMLGKNIPPLATLKQMVKVEHPKIIQDAKKTRLIQFS